jgi:hypothetical protein
MSLTLPGTLFRRPDGAIVYIKLRIPPQIEFAGRLFQIKGEFHVTLLGREALRLAGLLELPSLGGAIRQAAHGVRFSVEVLDDFRLVERGEAATIVRMCNVGGAEEFFRRFESETGAATARPPYHVTLYTAGTPKGIGLSSPADLERLGRRLGDEERRKYLRGIA